MLRRVTATISRLALIGLALLALGFATMVWLYELAQSWFEHRRFAAAYQITSEEPSGTSALTAQEVTVTESATSASD